VLTSDLLLNDILASKTGVLEEHGSSYKTSGRATEHKCKLMLAKNPKSAGAYEKVGAGRSSIFRAMV